MHVLETSIGYSSYDIFSRKGVLLGVSVIYDFI